MDKLKISARSARNRMAGTSSSGTPTASAAPQAVPQVTVAPTESSAPEDSYSTHAVNETVLGGQPGTSTRDFAASSAQNGQGPTIEPPTSLQSSVDAGAHVPTPSRYDNPSSHVSHRYV